MYSKSKDYELLEWIERDNDQHIIVPNVIYDNHTEMSCRFAPMNLDFSGWTMVCGMRNNNINLLIDYQRTNKGNVNVTTDVFRIPTALTPAVEIMQGETIEVRIVCNGDTVQIFANGELRNIYNIDEIIRANDFGVFCFVVEGVAQLRYTYCRIYSIDYHNSYRQFSLRPVRRLSDNAVGMYDTISKTFYANQGTGSFIAGPPTGRYL